MLQQLIDLMQSIALAGLREFILTAVMLILAPMIAVLTPRLITMLIKKLGLSWAQGLLLGLISRAEKLFDTGQGGLKFQWVYNVARKRIPKWLFNDDELRGMIEAVLASIGQGLGKLRQQVPTLESGETS